MIQILLSIDCNNGLLYNQWKHDEEYITFNNIASGKTIIVDCEMAKHLQPIPSYNIICVVDNVFPPIDTLNNVVNFMNIHDLITLIQTDINEEYLIIGGCKFFDYICKIPLCIDKIHIMKSFDNYNRPIEMKNEWIDNFIITSKNVFNHHNHIILECTENGERQYLNLIHYIIENGVERKSRSGDTLSVFKNDICFDLQNGFPLLTTKRMFIRGIIEEFIFFIQGHTNSNILSDKNVHIWDGNTSEEFIKDKGLPYAKGIMGPMYGYQWRYYNAQYNIDDKGHPYKPSGGIDQLKNVIYLINNDPTSRRILMTVYNPLQSDLGVLYPCHSIIIQFYVYDEYLDMFCYNRSQDVGLGVPFNIASSSLLLHVISKITHKIPRYLYMTMGDTHIYNEHVDSLKEQLNRIPYKFPSITIPELSFSDINNLKSDDFIINDYNYYESIKMNMKV